MDRFKEPIEPKHYDYCEYCKYEITYGDSFLESPQGYRMHDDLECITGFYQLVRKWAGEDII